MGITTLALKLATHNFGYQRKLTSKHNELTMQIQDGMKVKLLS